MNFPEDLKYHKEHTWVRLSGNRATIGITDYAQDELGDIVYIDLPDVDAEIEKDSEFTEIESTKATSTVIAPVSGTIVEVNEELDETPELINESPYDKGWIVVVEMSDPSEIDDLLDSSDYERFVEEESK
jgi:glycine cleavage system H protein